MSLPDVVSREQWLEARRRLLAREKEFTRSHDTLNADRRRLPMVKVDKEYVFQGPDGQVTLAELFGDKRQLIVQHVMFGPDWDKPCPGCSAAIDELSPGVLKHIGSRETAFVLASRAPYDKIAVAAKERGWTVAPWYSSYGSDFNYDYQVSLDEARARPTTTTDPSPAWSAVTAPPRCQATAPFCAKVTRSSTPTRPSPGAPSMSETPTPTSI